MGRNVDEPLPETARAQNEVAAEQSKQAPAVV